MRLADPYIYQKYYSGSVTKSFTSPSSLKVALHVHFKEQVDMNSGLLGAKKISMDLLIYKL